MEIRVTDYFSNDEYVLFGDSDNNSNEEGNEDEDKTAEDGNNAQPYDTDKPVNDTTDEDEVWSPPLVCKHFNLASGVVLLNLLSGQ